jgi:hypothetical protein
MSASGIRGFVRRVLTVAVSVVVSMAAWVAIFLVTVVLASYGMRRTESVILGTCVATLLVGLYWALGLSGRWRALGVFCVVMGVAAIGAFCIEMTPLTTGGPRALN